MELCDRASHGHPVDYANVAIVCALVHARLPAAAADARATQRTRQVELPIGASTSFHVSLSLARPCVTSGGGTLGRMVLSGTAPTKQCRSALARGCAQVKAFLWAAAWHAVGRQPHH